MHTRTVSVLAPAKINLTLYVLDGREDGFHEIDTIVQQLEFGDDVTVTVGADDHDRTDSSGRGRIVFAATHDPGCDPGPDQTNIARLAAERYLTEAPSRSFGRTSVLLDIHLHKRIPVGSGLGGGSSDAATVLRALDHLAEGALPGDRLARIGASLGSDVPSFLAGSPLVRARGRGEIVEALAPLPEREVVLVAPPAPISTAHAYRALAASREAGHPSRREVAAARIRPSRVSWSTLEDEAVNDFTEVAREYGEVDAALGALEETGCRPSGLSGSGSACFGVRPESEASASGTADPADFVTRFGVGWRVVRTRTLVSVPAIRHGCRAFRVS